MEVIGSFVIAGNPRPSVLTGIIKPSMAEHEAPSAFYPGTRIAGDARPTLLYLSPTLPSETGNGSALRADLHIEVLSRTFNIFLVVVQLYKERRFGKLPSASLLTRCNLILILPGKTEGSSIPAMLLKLGTYQFDRVHVFRLRMHSYLGYFSELIKPGAPRSLDLDDFESKKHFRFAALLASQGKGEDSLRLERIAARLVKLEREALSFYSCVAVSNAEDQAELALKYKDAKVIVIPNACRIPSSSREGTKKDSNYHSIVFVGSLQYFPNEDGVLFFVASILPLLREDSSRPVRLTVVGTRPSERLREICQRNDVAVTGEVPEVAAYYEQADLAVVPIRTGGGTRIKLLEASSYKVPVVSTSLGAEGLAVIHGTHLLIADSEREFADACLAVVNHPEAADQLTRNAFSLIASQHTVEATVEAFRMLMEEMK